MNSHEINNFIAQQHRVMTVKAMCPILGMSYGAVARRHTVLIHKGVIKRSECFYLPRWTADDAETLAECLLKNVSDAAIARKLGRSVYAIQVERKRAHIRARTRLFQSANAVAKRLGIALRIVLSWCKNKWLKARKGVGRYAQWYISEESLFDFLADKRYWRNRQVEKIPDPLLREWLLEGALI